MSPPKIKRHFTEKFSSFIRNKTSQSVYSQATQQRFSSLHTAYLMKKPQVHYPIRMIKSKLPAKLSFNFMTLFCTNIQFNLQSNSYMDIAPPPFPSPKTFKRLSTEGKIIFGKGGKIRPLSTKDKYFHKILMLF